MSFPTLCSGDMYDVCFLMTSCFYLYDRHVLPRHGDLLLEEIVGRSLGRPHSPDARHHGYPGLFSSTAFGTQTTTLLRFPAPHNTTFTARFDEVLCLRAAGQNVSWMGFSDLSSNQDAFYIWTMNAITLRTPNVAAEFITIVLLIRSVGGSNHCLETG